MSENDKLVPELSDADLFNSANADDAPADTPLETAAEPEAIADDGVNRDELGRFAPKEAAKDEALAPTEQQPEADGDRIPSWRLREVSEARRAEATRAEAAERRAADLERQFNELRQRMPAPEAPKPAEVPDPLMDPQGYQKHIEGSFEQRLVAQAREFSFQLAHQKHGTLFDEAFEAGKVAAAHGDVQFLAAMNNSRQPGETLVSWHRQQKTMQQVGNDPNAWFEQQLEERIAKDQAFAGKVLKRIQTGVASPVNGSQSNARPASVVQLPPSLSRTASAAASDADDNDVSDEALFRNAMRR